MCDAVVSHHLRLKQVKHIDMYVIRSKSLKERLTSGLKESKWDVFFVKGSVCDEVGGLYPLLLGKTWLSEMNLSIRQQKLSCIVLSQTVAQALIWSKKYPGMGFSWHFFHALDFTCAVCDQQFGKTYGEACKRIEMATSHVTPLISAGLLRDHQGWW